MSSNNLRAVKSENTLKTDFQTMEELTGREIKPPELFAPKFSDHSVRAVSFGKLKNILKGLSK